MMSTIRKEAELVAVTMALILASPAASRAQKPEDEVQTPETSRSARQPAPEPPQAQTPPEEKTQKIPDEDVREQNRPITGSELEDADFPGSWPMFGQKARMKIGGYVKADFLYDFDGTLDRTQFLMSTIPVEGTPESANSGYVSFFARESRFNVDVRRVEEGKAPLRLFLEGDFWSSGNQFRLRHAYVVFGNFLAGQTWTNLSALESLPVLIDFAAGDALFGGRTTQLRYQRQVKERWKLSASVENLDFMGIENPLGLSGEPSAALPLVSLRADYKCKTGLLILGSSVGQLRWDGGADGPDARAVQWDALVAGRKYFGKNDFVTWNVSYGKGSGENIMAFIGSDRTPC